MSRELCEKLSVTFFLVCFYLFMPKVGYLHAFGDARGHLLYMFSHANLWHLSGNIFVLWLMKPKLYLLWGMAIALGCSFLPCTGTLWDLIGGTDDGAVTMGFSGVLFAIGGVKWGRYWRHESGRWPSDPLFGKRCPVRDFMTKVFPLSLLGVLIPHVNWCLHAWCMLVGFVFARLKKL